MPTYARAIAAIASLLALQACATSPPPAPPAPYTYAWLPTIDARNDATTDRARAQLDILLPQRGYCQAANAALALAISAGGRRNGSGSPGFGSYLGGYAVLAPDPAPDGFVQIDAYDGQSLQLVWRLRLRRDATTGANIAELNDALSNRLPRRSTHAPGDGGLHASPTRNGGKALCTAAAQ